MKATDILFINPPFPVNHRHKLVLPLSISQIMEYLRERNKKVKFSLVDVHLNNLKIKDILDYVDMKKPDVICMGYLTCQAPFVYELSKKVKELYPKIMLVHGGVHATFSYSQALEYCDIVIIGEGEKTFSDIIMAKQKNIGFEGVKGIAFKKNRKIIKTDEQPLIENLDEIPFPNTDFFDINKYFKGNVRQLHVVGGKRMPILVSRGCPYSCSFCLSPDMWKQKVRWKSPKRVIEEIIRLHKSFGFDRFQFYDDNFLLNRVFVEELCEYISKLDFGIRWIALSRASQVIDNKDLLPKLKKAGCVGIEMGLETADDRILQKLKKGQDLDLFGKAVDLLKKEGINPLYTIMVFSPEETINSIKKIREYVKQKIPESLSYNFFGYSPEITLGQFSTPYPGTNFFENRLKDGIVLAEDSSDMFHQQINFLPKSLLKDIPVSISPISKEIVDKCVEVAVMSLFKYFTGNEKEDNKNRIEMREISERFYELINGTRNIEGIVEKISKEDNIDLMKTFRFVALATIVFAQNNIISSNLKEEEIKLMQNVC
jgi:radical SAM superfamily enzyme YgiQ (UPF0313 family)